MSRSRARADAPDEERKVLAVEEDDVGGAMVDEDLDLVAEDVDEPDEDEGIGDECRAGQLLDVTDECESCRAGEGKGQSGSGRGGTGRRWREEGELTHAGR